MFSICQHFYTLGVEVYFTRIEKITWTEFGYCDFCVSWCEW